MITLETLGYLLEFLFVSPQTWAERFTDAYAGFGLQVFGLLFLLLAPAALVQYLTLRYCHRWYFRWLPLLVILSVLVFGEIMAAKTSSWDGFGWGLFTSFAAYALFGDLLVVLLWCLRHRKKNQT